MWLEGSGSLDADGVCISEVPALDRDAIGCVQWLVCLSPLDTEGVSGWCPI